MHLADYLAADAVALRLAAASADDVLPELVALLDPDPADAAVMLKMLRRRESLGSTGVGRGVAIPHCRLPQVTRVRVAYGRSPAGITFASIDGQPVHHFFLIVAPPPEVSTDYLPVLGRVAQFVKDADVPERLAALADPAALFALLEEKRV